MSDQQQSAKEKPRKRRALACAECGREIAPERQVQRLQKKVAEELGEAVDVSLMELCPACRRKRYAASLLDKTER
jgi:hypothetical protein